MRSIIRYLFYNERECQLEAGTAYKDLFINSYFLLKFLTLTWHDAVDAAHVSSSHFSIISIVNCPLKKVATSGCISPLERTRPKNSPSIRTRFINLSFSGPPGTMTKWRSAVNVPGFRGTQNSFRTLITRVITSKKQLFNCWSFNRTVTLVINWS